MEFHLGQSKTKSFTTYFALGQKNKMLSLSLKNRVKLSGESVIKYGTDIQLLYSRLDVFWKNIHCAHIFVKD